MPSAALAHVYSALREWCATDLGKCPKVIEVAFDDGDHMRLTLPAAMVRPAHSIDFRSVNWYGQEFEFTTTQAACMRLLWSAWESGSPEIGQDTILETAGSDQRRLDSVFKDNSAWGTLIVPGKTKGAFRLQ